MPETSGIEANEVSGWQIGERTPTLDVDCFSHQLDALQVQICPDLRRAWKRGIGVTEVASKPLKSGTPAPASGQYEIRGPRGGSAGGQERTVVRGEPLPPTPKSGQTYDLVDRTKNGAGRGR
ncbi:hypothetical protein GCM10020255_007930 [Rhodococcus baikonurensis]